ncbi:MAG TPA: ATP-binding cassette domain-containing protein [Candidatus Dormibacteraeota bacterium]|jgi:ABC-type branched-subunit amino acid transport system ATPase component|nr:ATP-binding cassette domain-containing protein [Candidatus Dormibacteraeota bacterium]
MTQPPAPGATGDHDLSVDELHLERDGRTLLDIAHLRAPAGECTVVLGGADAGKTVLALALSGALPDARATVRCGPHTISGTPAQRMRRGLAVVAADALRIRGISVAEALDLAARGNRRRVSAAYDRFPMLASRGRLPTDRLSGGEHQALRIACAVASQPRALVLDSPTTGLAAEVADAVLILARDQAQRGVAVLWLDQPGAPLPAPATHRLDRGGLSAAAVSRTEYPTAPA